MRTTGAVLNRHMGNGVPQVPARNHATLAQLYELPWRISPVGRVMGPELLCFVPSGQPGLMPYVYSWLWLCPVIDRIFASRMRIIGFSQAMAEPGHGCYPCQHDSARALGYLSVPARTFNRQFT